MLETLDQSLFYSINGLEFGKFDQILILCREKTTWIPLYVFILGFACWHLKWKKALLFVLFSVSCIAVGDQLSSNLIKKSVKRPRPCHEAAQLADLNLRVHCGGGYSFTSSHATNHMALAVFWFFALYPFHRKWRWLLIFWAGLVGFCQVFVGVHYPIDVLSGAFLGGSIGALAWLLFRAIKIDSPSPS